MPHNQPVHGTTAPPIVRAVAVAVAEAGGRALVVGGWVRDGLRGHPSKDVDIEVFGIAAPRLPDVLAPLGRVEAVWIHTLLVIDRARALNGDLRPAAAQFSMPRTSSRGDPRSVTPGVPHLTWLPRSFSLHLASLSEHNLRSR